MKVEVGQKIYGQYGAMIPTVYGVVDRIDDNGVVYFYDQYAPEEVYTCPTEYIAPLQRPDDIFELPLAVGVYA